MNLEDVKVRLYHLQQRLKITRSEATALLAFAALLLAGLLASHLQGRPRAVPGSEQAATDPRFQAGAARLRAMQDEADSQATGAREAAEPPPAPSSSTPLNLNAATPDALERLPGVGPVIAGRIVAYRQAHGPFAVTGHLERVSGIGPKTMARLAPLLVAGEAEAAIDTVKSDTAAGGAKRVP